MMAQPGVHVREGFALDGSDSSPVARAIVAGLTMSGSPSADEAVNEADKLLS